MGFIQYPSNRPASGDNDNALLRKLLSVALSTGQISQETYDRLTSMHADLALLLLAAQNGIPLRDGITSDTVYVRDGHASVMSVPFDFEIAHDGQYNGKAAVTYRILGRRTGFNSTSILQDVGEWLATSINAFPVLTGAEALEVVSSNIADDGSPGGTGAQMVRVTYIDTNDDLVTSPDIVLDGTTPVAAGFTAKAILWMEVTAVGSNTVAVGNVDLRAVSGSVIQERITAGGNKSLSARFRVPRNYTAFVPRWMASAISNPMDCRLRAKVSSSTRTPSKRLSASPR